MIRITPENYNKHLPMVLMFYKDNLTCQRKKEEALSYISNNIRFGLCDVDEYFEFSYNFMLRRNTYNIPSLFFCDKDYQGIINLTNLKFMRKCINAIEGD